MLFKKFVLFIGFCTIGLNVFAQDKGKNEFGIHVGGLFYQGDLAPGILGSFKTAKPVAGIFYNRILTPYWSVRANLDFGGLKGDDAKNEEPDYMKRRNFNFNTPLTELSLLGVFNLFGNNLDGSMTQRLSPYVFAGGGAAFVNIKRDWSRIDSSMLHNGGNTLAGLLRDSATELPKTLAVIPMGAGIKYALSPRVALALEGTYRVTFTDYLDGFSYAANPDRKDSYYGLTIGAVFNFGGSSGSGYGGGGMFRKGGKSKTGCPTVF
ncbi:MAG: DUF6089 family protein [Bacteroidota bacterium]